jgi:hypothetical protein
MNLGRDKPRTNRSETGLVVALLVIACGCVRGIAQSTSLASSPSAEAVALQRDAYLAELGLLRPLAASLRAQLAKTQGDARHVMAEQLGGLYAKMLGSNPTSDERKQLEAYCRSLLADVPESATPTLRLTLVEAQYLPVEDLVERMELQLATPDEITEAKRVLADVVPAFERICHELSDRVRAAEARKGAGTVTDEEADRLRAELEQYRKSRSQAEFRAGWACYYSALLTGDNRNATRALEHFGVILNAAPGRPATIDRLPVEQLKYDHIAKSALGCALATSHLGNAPGAVRWIDEIERAPELDAGVAAQLLRRKMVVLAADNRWADIRISVMRSRSGESGKPSPLSLADARTLAVLSLDAMKQPDFREGLRSVAQEMVRVAMDDLVARGEVGHVLSLVRSYGTAIIGADGFINNYVRALRAYDDARALHKEQEPDNTNSPAHADAVINAYRQVAGLFNGALRASDAAKYGSLRAQASICMGLSQHYAGSLEEAAATFELAFASQAAEADRRNALQYAIASLSLAVRNGAKQLEARKDKLETLFIQTFPNTREANAMVLQRTSGGKGLSVADIESLLKVPKEDPLYQASRSVAADGLYRIWKRPAGTAARDFAALRYADVAQDLLRVEFAQAISSDDPAAKHTADTVVNRARRIAEVLLACSAPDINRAQDVLAMIVSVSKFHGAKLDSIQDELAFRRFQIAVSKRDPAATEKELVTLRELGGPFVAAAERFMYKRAFDEWTANAADMDAAGRVVSSGSRVLLQADFAAGSQATVRETVAAAAAAIWAVRGENEMRDLALRMDREQMTKGFKTLTTLRRLASLEEASGRADASAAAWLELLAACEEDSDAWYEARYESIRVTAKVNPAQARTAFDQFKTLHPGLGPKPWDAKFEALLQSLASGTVPAIPGGGK